MVSPLAADAIFAPLWEGEDEGSVTAVVSTGPTAEASPLVVHWSHETIEVVVASRPEDEAEEASTGRNGFMDMER
jgi:hypothetical protein